MKKIYFFDKFLVSFLLRKLQKISFNCEDQIGRENTGLSTSPSHPCKVVVRTKSMNNEEQWDN